MSHLPPPPTLSFRSFHELHFSRSQRRSFFAAAPSPWLPPYIQGPNWSQSVEDIAPAVHDTITVSTYHQDCRDDNDAEEPSVVSDVIPEFPGLSKEALEIFEFSRRFRQQKAEAAHVEQAQAKKRRIKRRRLTKLGFALDEGNSGTDDSRDNSVEPVENRQDNSGEGEGHDDSDDDEDLDDDQDLAQVELAATDVSFLYQNSRRLDRMRQQLYGTDDSVSNIPGSMNGRQTIDMLEGLLNQAYEDSLGALGTETEQQTLSGTSRQKSQGAGHRQFKERSGQSVYWPGIPLRC
ncbi:hypothetical protein BGZ99_009557 [Dissophora globulifera]|uniref:Uncharacterized protein n=1 Tax=Dissophora globulifera TaxID=979702 RepID=A0A9P6RUL1_9FUNG|nr:hypothetical protein BGZ99_009557 [Dissophora globulifera]